MDNVIIIVKLVAVDLWNFDKCVCYYAKFHMMFFVVERQTFAPDPPVKV